MNNYSLNYEMPYQNDLIPFHGNLVANDTSVIYLQNETKIRHKAHKITKLFEFCTICVVPIELVYAASTSHVPTTVTIVDPIKYIVPIWNATLFIFIGLVETNLALK